MNGIEKITGRIAAEARSEADAILTEAKEKSAAIKAEYEKKAQEAYWQIVREGAADTEQRLQRRERTARLEGRKELLALKQDMIAAVYKMAAEQILALGGDDYAAFLSRLAGGAALSGTEQVILSAADRARLGERVVAKANVLAAERGVPGSMTLSAETRDIPGGVILKQGDIEVNCSLDTLIALRRNELDARIADILFG